MGPTVHAGICRGCLGDDHITWSTNWRSGSSTSFNGWATPKFDKDRGLAVIEVNDMAGMVAGGADGDKSYEAFFALLWDKLIEQIER